MARRPSRILMRVCEQQGSRPCASPLFVCTKPPTKFYLNAHAIPQCDTYDIVSSLSWSHADPGIGIVGGIGSGSIESPVLTPGIRSPATTTRSRPCNDQALEEETPVPRPPALFDPLHSLLTTPAAIQRHHRLTLSFSLIEPNDSPVSTRQSNRPCCAFPWGALFHLNQDAKTHKNLIRIDSVSTKV